jgi:hypothetical protein
MIRNFLALKEKEKKLIYVLLVLLGVGILIWVIYFKPISVFEIKIFYPEEKEVKLNLEILENSLLKNLEPFPQISSATSGEIGKENPFLK